MSIHFLPGRGFDCNLYLIEGREPILVDTGTGDHIDGIIDTMGSMVDPAKIRTILLTHRHYDHVGGASQLIKRIGAKVFIHERDAQVVKNGDNWGTMSAMFSRDIDAIDVTPIKDGETFHTGDHTLKVIHTPGHSAGSICLYDDETKDLISGDTVFVGGVGRWDLPSGDFDALVKSVKSLRALDVRNLYPGHGPCGIGNGNEQIAEALGYLGES